MARTTPSSTIAMSGSPSRSNDERTAKRISDALGTATELRAQRNYAGHRLAPWLSHVMVSRQETARPLLTPGEVMQLPRQGRAGPRLRPARRSGPRSCATTRTGISRAGSCPRRSWHRRAMTTGRRRGRTIGADRSAVSISACTTRLQDSLALAELEEGGLQQERHPGLPEEASRSPGCRPRRHASAVRRRRSSR